MHVSFCHSLQTHKFRPGSIRKPGGPFDTIQTIVYRGVSLLTLVWNVDHAQCSDFRDRLFALYSLLDNPSTETLPMVDYEVRRDENYMSFAVSCISNGHFDTIRHGFSFLGTRLEAISSEELARMAISAWKLSLR